jgi:hypothetical protein
MTKIDDKTPEALAPSPNSLLQFGLANAEVRLSMAKRAQLSDPVQLLLAKVGDQRVNLLLAARLDISTETASELLHQGDCAVQQVLADTEDRRAKELEDDARSTPRPSPERSDIRRLTTDEKNGEWWQLSSWLICPSEQIWEDSFDFDGRTFDFEQLLEALADPNTSPQLLAEAEYDRRLSAFMGHTVAAPRITEAAMSARARLASNPSTPFDSLLRLDNTHVDKVTRNPAFRLTAMFDSRALKLLYIYDIPKFIARCDEANLYVMRAFATDPYKREALSIWTAALNNPHCPVDLLRTFTDREPELRALLAKHPSLPSDLHPRLAQDLCEDVRVALASRSDLKEETIVALIEAGGDAVSSELVLNPALAINPTVVDLVVGAVH